MQWREADVGESVGTWLVSGLMVLATVSLVYYFGF
jgi:hypothetical protein